MSQKIFNPKWHSYWKLWNEIEPPWRPAPIELNFWEKKILKIKKDNNSCKALVLGSTPEIRDLLAKHQIDTTLLDISRTMHQAMSRLAKLKNKKEKLVIGNWLEADKIFHNNVFDLIISDDPYSNIAFKDWRRFLKAVYNILKPNAYFLVAAIIDDATSRLSVKNIFEIYKKDPKYFQNFKNRAWLLYNLIGEKGVYDKKIKGFKYNKLRTILKKEGVKYGLTLKEIGKLWFIMGDINGEKLGNYIETETTIEELLQIQLNYFYLDKIFQIKSHPAFKIERAMILKSKKSK